MTYDFKEAIAKAQQDFNHFHELIEAQHNIDMIQAQFAQLQSEHRHAVTQYQALERKVIQNHIYSVMMETINEHESVREAFEALLAVMKLADPDIENKMKYKGLGHE